ncbi:LOW QUALITY PROTEIN: hypothetical protein KUF71_017646 [Frankliniella fusca]|uniref:Uncharacterized protein n=1 Tax=Frankliniella fusca TaxID=407009 RepID=A0AAE1LRL4_9NEOP|nr:LOW QUALITY PROTEIN: hypothetical protein KUF71_017646 [Frankliniella fusca]
MEVEENIVNEKTDTVQTSLSVKPPVISPDIPVLKECCEKSDSHREVDFVPCYMLGSESRPGFDSRVDKFKSEMENLFDIASRVQPTRVVPRDEKRQAMLDCGLVNKRQRKATSGEPLPEAMCTEAEVKAEPEDNLYEPGTSRSLPPPSSCLTNLDRGLVSSRAAFRTLASSAAETEGDCASHTTLWRRRKEERAEVAEDIRRAFNPTVPLTVHWDGIKLPPLDGKLVDGKEVVERLPIVLSGPGGVDQLLSAGVLADGTGEAQATAVADQIAAWGCTERVTAACTDTTSSNTGSHKGAFVMLEKKLEKTLIYIACRHHQLEIIPKNVFEKCVEESSSPDIGSLCRGFKKNWDTMDHSLYLPATKDPKCCKVLAKFDVEHILNFAKEALKKPLSRNDYKYLLELTIIFLGEVPPTQPNGVRFQPPMALSSARFMGRIIYALQIHMFALTGQYKLNAKLLEKVRAFNLFHVLVYLEPWYSATEAISAPRTDLLLIQKIARYSAVNKKLAQVALNAFKNHLWYLSAHCVPFALFDDNVSVEEKSAMVANFKKTGARGRTPMRYPVGPDVGPSEILEFRLSQFCSQDSMLFFFSLDTIFLEKCPKEWSQDKGCNENVRLLRDVQVVNDTAERGVALVKTFTGQLTKDEKDFQNLLLVQKKVKSQEQGNAMSVGYFVQKSEDD